VQQERLEHFVSRYAFNIEGLGKETIEALIAGGFVDDPSDIFMLTESDLLQLPLFKELKTRNVLRSIERAKRMPVDRFLFALGIRHIGRETADLIARRIAWPARKLTVKESDGLAAQDSLFGAPEQTIEIHGISLQDLLATMQGMTAEQLAAFHGVGDVNAQALHEWFREKENTQMLRHMQSAGVVCLQSERSNIEPIFEGKIFVLTGTLPTLSREEARTMIKDRGGKVSGSVSKKTKYVLAGDDPGGKLDEAKAFGVPVIGEMEFRALLKA
jgi:DNA ligase (NAD+)